MGAETGRFVKDDAVNRILPWVGGRASLPVCSRNSDGPQISHVAACGQFGESVAVHLLSELQTGSPGARWARAPQSCRQQRWARSSGSRPAASLALGWHRTIASVKGESRLFFYVILKVKSLYLQAYDSRERERDMGTPLMDSIIPSPWRLLRKHQHHLQQRPENMAQADTGSPQKHLSASGTLLHGRSVPKHRELNKPF